MAGPDSQRTLVVLQPGYLPWLGFFDQMDQADVFVYYDDVQYDKHGWRNRNRIKAPNGPAWLTVPVRHKGLGWPNNLEVEIDSRTPWARKHVGSLRQYYSRAPYLRRYLPELDELLNRNWVRLVDLNYALTDCLCRWLGIQVQIERSSESGIHSDKSDRLLQLCRHFGANRYLSGAAARDYLDVPKFLEGGVSVAWQDYRHPTYPQLHGEFAPYLSVIDLLFNCGDDSMGILRRGSHTAPADIAGHDPGRVLSLSAEPVGAEELC